MHCICIVSDFKVISPSMMWQSDIGREFSGRAMSANECHRQVSITPKFPDEVIAKIKNLWPYCRMMCGSPCHFESNGRVGFVNRTVLLKLSNWM